MDDYEDIEYEDREYLQEYKALERTSYHPKINDLVIDIENPTKEEKFLININNVGISIINNDEFKHINGRLLDYNVLGKILDEASGKTKKEFKNPSAFILGYLCLTDDKEIDKKKFLKITSTDSLEHFKDAGVTPPDVLRYARFLYTPSD